MRRRIVGTMIDQGGSHADDDGSFLCCKIQYSVNTLPVVAIYFKHVRINICIVLHVVNTGYTLRVRTQNTD